MDHLRSLLDRIVSDQPTHERWLATLSYLENRGARKIMAFQPDRDLSLTLLRHAAEEARHAYFFKKQITRLTNRVAECYPLLGGHVGRRYLHRLDIGICRSLKQGLGYRGRALMDASYLLTTLAIEERAGLLYPLYHEVLAAHGLKISLASVIKEEDTHLEEINAELARHPELESHADFARRLEQGLFETFVAAVNAETAALCTV